MPEPDIGAELIDQIDWHWRNQLRPRLDGLTDGEYFWEPVEGCWNLRPRDPSAPQPQPGSGALTIDYSFPEPVPAPVTTIAWRLSHILVGVLGARLAGHFGAEPCDYFSYDYPRTADEALRRLDALYSRWIIGVGSWSATDLGVAVGAAEPEQYAERTRATLVLHINRELIHHGAEIALLRDLYAHSRPTVQGRPVIA